MDTNEQHAEENPLTEDELLKKHRQERKDLQSKIQNMKKIAAKGDKKKKKDIQEAIVQLEKDLDEKQAQELSLLSDKQKSPDGSEDDEPRADTRVTRAQRRRNKKNSEDRAREKRILEQEETNKQGPRVMESNTIKEILESAGLQIYNIPADGNCLYCAVNHQLEVKGKPTYTVTRLRKLTADFMRENKDEFLPFMYSESEEVVSEEEFNTYCNEVATTKLWGGQLELRALSNILESPIKVIQASGPSTIQGENYSGDPLILTYHRHLYRLGEHYNSTVTASVDNNDF